ncbi:hypothetical protein [Ornithinimicrobium ciconiae]|uniref:hypothetical protein n=1 Tax=Ornithinimicrobium ciconiae TaxID=2594265 RepID=UPI0013FCF878|nr:hypothetical protein [Ornithinimicrobium ciconiae]
MGDVGATGRAFDLADARVDELFWDLVCADEDLLRAEFDAIVAAGYPARPRRQRPLLPPRPGPGALDDPPPALEVPRPADPGRRVPAARQRGPPHDLDRPDSDHEGGAPSPDDKRRATPRSTRAAVARPGRRWPRAQHVHL